MCFFFGVAFFFFVCVCVRQCAERDSFFFFLPFSVADAICDSDYIHKRCFFHMLADSSVKRKNKKKLL